MNEQRYNRGFLGSVSLAVAVALLFLAAASPTFISAAAGSCRCTVSSGMTNACR